MPAAHAGARAAGGARVYGQGVHVPAARRLRRAGAGGALRVHVVAACRGRPAARGRLAAAREPLRHLAATRA
eukprot:80779-Pleurochrysis_carterae.AAC.1